MEGLKVVVSLKDTEFFRILLDLIKSFTDDERLDPNIRDEYKDKITKLMEENKDE